MNNFSNQDQLQAIAETITGYTRTPFALDSIPGAFMENVLASVRNAISLNTYDFIDVYDKANNIGWQVKSTKDSTPVTWKRAKIANAENLIKESKQSKTGLQNLGNAIIDFCNHHAQESLDLYGLKEIYYSRLVLFEERKVLYFERLLCTKEKPIIFNPSDFTWEWSTPKITIKKEQLQALHGRHIQTDTKWFAWHGLGENQLHFSGEKHWWPKPGNKSFIEFSFPSAEERLTQKEFMALLRSLSK
jgi:hypothetical protein